MDDLYTIGSSVVNVFWITCMDYADVNKRYVIHFLDGTTLSVSEDDWIHRRKA